MNNDNNLNLHSMTKLLGWLRYGQEYKGQHQNNFNRSLSTRLIANERLELKCI